MKCIKCRKNEVVWIQKGRAHGYCGDCTRAIAREELNKLKRHR